MQTTNVEQVQPWEGVRLPPTITRAFCAAAGVDLEQVTPTAREKLELRCDTLATLLAFYAAELR